MRRAVFRIKYVPVEGTAEIQAPVSTIPEPFALRCARTANDPGSKGYDPVDNNCGAFPDYEMVPVVQSNHRIGGFFDTDDMVRVEVHNLSVHACHKNHAVTGFIEISL